MKIPVIHGFVMDAVFYVPGIRSSIAERRYIAPRLRGVSGLSPYCMESLQRSLRAHRPFMLDEGTVPKELLITEYFLGVLNISSDSISPFQPAGMLSLRLESTLALWKCSQQKFR